MRFSLVLLSAVLCAQSDRGNLTGTVTDAGAAAIPGAVIVATHDDSRTTFRQTAGEGGEFHLPGLPVGAYRVTIEHAGFKSSVHNNVRVEAGASARVDAKLEVGEVRQTIEVQESSAQLQIDNAKIQNTISDRMIEELPTVMDNGNAELAKQIGDDIAEFTWRKREDLVKAAKIHLMPDGVALAKKAVETGKVPVILADHSDRSGAATWLLEQVIEQGLSKTLIATLADEEACARLASAKVGDPIDMAVGGKLDESAGKPIPIKGRVRYIVDTQGRRNGPGQRWIGVEIERGNVVVLSPYLVQIIEVDTLRAAGLEPDSFDVIAIKSRAHFRRGFDDNGWAKTILLVEPLEPFLGTVRLEALPYKHADLKKFYPYGSPQFP